MRFIDEINKAKERGYSLGQFNFCTLEQLKGIVKAAQRMGVSVILGTSEGESSFFGLREAVGMRDVLRKDYPNIFLNLDHGKDLDWINKAIEAGYDMIHFDGSDLPLEENIEITKKIAKITKKKGIVLEGEVGKVGGSSKFHKGAPEKSETLTSIDAIVRFIEETDVDLCAFSVGNIHGMYEEMPKLDFDRIIEIRKRCGNRFVMHGGSGISDEEIKKSIQNGVVKVNVNTELRQIWRNIIEQNFSENKDELVPYKLLNGVSEKIEEKTIEKIKIFYENSF